jgi:hypothetical protein
VANQWSKREQDTNPTAGYENTYNLTYDSDGNMTSDRSERARRRDAPALVDSILKNP